MGDTLVLAGFGLAGSGCFGRFASGVCKGYCGRAGRGAECGTGRGSKEERIRIHLQVWANIRNNGYKR